MLQGVFFPKKLHKITTPYNSLQKSKLNLFKINKENTKIRSVKIPMSILCLSSWLSTCTWLSFRANQKYYIVKKAFSLAVLWYILKNSRLQNIETTAQATKFSIKDFFIFLCSDVARTHEISKMKSFVTIINY